MTVCLSWAFRALPILVLATGACNEPPKTAEGSTPRGTAIYIQTGWTDPWSKMYDRMMDAAIKEKAGQVDVQQVSSDGDSKKQIKAIDDAIAKKPGVLLVSPIDESVLPAIAKAKASGIFVFQLDRCYVQFWNKKNPTNSFYGSDLASAGASCPFQYAHVMRKKGTVLAVPDTSSQTGREILVGLKDGFKKVGNKITGVVGEDCGNDERKTKAFVSSYLKSGKPVDVIFTENEAATMGAAEAVKEAGVKKYIFGVGRITKGIVNVVKDGSVYAMFTVTPGGPAAMEEVPVALQGQRVPRDHFTPPDMVTQKNVDQYLKDHPDSGI